MKNLLVSLKSPAILSLLLVTPFMVMEVVNRRNFKEDFPVALFGVMWLLPVVFLLILVPVVRSARAGNPPMANPVKFLLSISLLVLIVIVWVGILLDQMPCFLGVPLCD